MTQEPPRQPWLHDLDITVLGTATCVSGADGDLGDSPASGLYVDDRRVVRDLRLSYDGHRPVRLTSRAVGHRADSYLVARMLGPLGADPTVTVRRTRTLVGLGAEELLVVSSSAQEPIGTTLTVEIGGDGLDLASVKAGGDSPGLLPARATTPGRGEWRDGSHVTRVTAPGATSCVLDSGALALSWEIDVEPGAPVEVGFAVEARRLHPTPFDPGSGALLVDWSAFRVQADDRRLDLTVDTSVLDLTGLLQTDPLDHDDVYLGAGSPWYLTLFGRDSIWAARFGLPLGTQLAGGTLRSLARRQGRQHDLATAEEPGKIVHEVRRADPDGTAGSHALPPVYYGTVDATPLWVLLLHDAWRWGLPTAQVAALDPALEAAVRWIRDSVSASDDGLLRYNDHTGRGLSNQGWKDSHDAMRRRDGSIAVSPIALLEVQGYAVQAARAAADLLGNSDSWEHRAPDQVAGLLAWADDLEARVRERFWVTDAEGPYLAMALDRDGQPVDGVASNMGHVVGTGLLTPDEDVLVARRLTSPDLLGQFGIGTLGRANPAYNPIGYHTGSVWVHDSTIGVRGLAAAGQDAAAARTLRALLEGAMHVDFRFPELYAADPALATPAPYPASCRPQAWSAASALAMVTSILGLEPDLPAGRVRLRPLRPSPVGAVSVTGLRLGAGSLSVSLDAEGHVLDVEAPAGLEVEVTGA
ncbi:MAG TPA: glycogen debranching N-terminal domain-containing protein [Nocardioides sp.]|nr:glycogen debranching N-terminal domain-containing protein [Nocardioides sp.]